MLIHLEPKTLEELEKDLYNILENKVSFVATDCDCNTDRGTETWTEIDMIEDIDIIIRPQNGLSINDVVDMIKEIEVYHPTFTNILTYFKIEDLTLNEIKISVYYLE